MSDKLLAAAFGVLIGMVLVILVATLVSGSEDSQCLHTGYYGHARLTAKGGLYCVKTLTPEVVIVPYKEESSR